MVVWFLELFDRGLSLKRVVVESPYAGDVGKNTRYAQLCLRDCLRRGEAPFASHLLYTQPNILDDTIPAERKLGMEAGFVWGLAGDITAVYEDLGTSAGMREGIKRALWSGRRIEYRKLPNDLWQMFLEEQMLLEEDILNLGASVVKPR